jgi:hypothetical protein
MTPSCLLQRPSLREQPTAEPLPVAFVPLTSAGLSNRVVLLWTQGDPAVVAPSFVMKCGGSTRMCRSTDS